jgi:hypothetical protein
MDVLERVDEYGAYDYRFSFVSHRARAAVNRCLTNLLTNPRLVSQLAKIGLEHLVSENNRSMSAIRRISQALFGRVGQAAPLLSMEQIDRKVYETTVQTWKAVLKGFQIPRSQIINLNVELERHLTIDRIYTKSAPDRNRDLRVEHREDGSLADRFPREISFTIDSLSQECLSDYFTLWMQSQENRPAIEELKLSGRPICVLHPALRFVKITKLLCKDCSLLENLPDTIDLRDISTLDFTGCVKLSRLPLKLPKKIFRQISFQGCTGLKSFPPEFLNQSTILNLNMSGCAGLTSLPDGFFDLAKVHNLNLSRCGRLTVFPRKKAVSGLAVEPIQKMQLFDTPISAAPGWKFKSFSPTSSIQWIEKEGTFFPTLYFHDVFNTRYELFPGNQWLLTLSDPKSKIFNRIDITLLPAVLRSKTSRIALNVFFSAITLGLSQLAKFSVYKRVLRET